MASILPFLLLMGQPGNETTFHDECININSKYALPLGSIE